MDNNKSKKHQPVPELSDVVSEIRSDIEAIEQELSFYNETNFIGRAEIIDDIEFHIVDRIDALLKNHGPVEPVLSLKKNVEEVKARFEKIDYSLFQQLRESIKTGDCRGAAFRKMIEVYIRDCLNSDPVQNKPGYDHLDTFTNRLLPVQTTPDAVKEREPEMVFYQKTPSRIIFELVEKADFGKGDVFYDLGSGLGHVAILVNLLSGVVTRGVEFEPAYCDYAICCARELNLPDVQFINADARVADYSDGTIFFMYTPFEGRILQDVLERLRLESLRRSIRILTYGPCTLEVGAQNWLRCEYTEKNNIYKLGMLTSRTELRR